MTKMAAVWIASALLLALCSGLTQAGKHCHITHQGHEITKYCDYGCCIDRCCRHVHEKFMDNWVIGVIVIVCVFVGVAIMASICHCLKHGLSGNWNHPAPQPPRPCVAVINQGYQQNPGIYNPPPQPGVYPTTTYVVNPTYTTGP